ncbi:unnamed protein product, partial [Bubo scandiacus]
AVGRLGRGTGTALPSQGGPRSHARSPGALPRRRGSHPRRVLGDGSGSPSATPSPGRGNPAPSCCPGPGARPKGLPGRRPYVGRYSFKLTGGNEVIACGRGVCSLP